MLDFTTDPSPVHCPLTSKEKQVLFQKKIKFGVWMFGEARSCLRQPRPSLDPVCDAADNSALSEKSLAAPSFGLVFPAISGWMETKGSIQEIHFEQQSEPEDGEGRFPLDLG